jgi:hypothetical protein
LLEHVAGDVFYVPRSLFQRFHLISTLFRRFEVFLEVAVPYILTGLDPNNSMVRISGKYFWGDAEFRGIVKFSTISIQYSLLCTFNYAIIHL